MIDAKIIASVVKYAKKIADEGLFGTGDMISIRVGDTMYVTEKGCDFAAVTPQNVLSMQLSEARDDYALFASVYLSREDINAVCHCHPKWVAPVAKAGRTIPAVLDDMAQIVGPTCKTSANNTIDILRTLRGRNSCLIKDDGCLTSGRTLDEAYTCVLVLDKASRCFVSSAVIGRNRTINLIEAKLMRFIYKTKYSKKNQENISAQEGEA